MSLLRSICLLLAAGLAVPVGAGDGSTRMAVSVTVVRRPAMAPRAATPATGPTAPREGTAPAAPPPGTLALRGVDGLRTSRAGER